MPDVYDHDSEQPNDQTEGPAQEGQQSGEAPQESPDLGGLSVEDIAKGAFRAAPTAPRFFPAVKALVAVVAKGFVALVAWVAGLSTLALSALVVVIVLVIGVTWIAVTSDNDLPTGGVQVVIPSEQAQEVSRQGDVVVVAPPAAVEQPPAAAEPAPVEPATEPSDLCPDVSPPMDFESIGYELTPRDGCDYRIDKNVSGEIRALIWFFQLSSPRSVDDAAAALRELAVSAGYNDCMLPGIDSLMVCSNADGRRAGILSVGTSTLNFNWQPIDWELDMLDLDFGGPLHDID